MNYLDKNIKKNKKKYDEILSKIKQYDTIVIFRHIAPDFDALGCQFGLYTWLKENFKDKKIITLGDNHVSFTGRIYPEVNKISNKYLSEHKFLGIICDVGDKKRIADPRFEQADFLVKIDHHPTDEKVANINICEPDKSSCSEMVANMLFYFSKGKLKVSKNAARYLYIGMVGDNGRFMFSSTSNFTFNIAAKLLDTGINIVGIYEEMYKKKLKDLEFTKYVLENYKVSKYGVCYYVLEQKELEKLGLSCDQGKENVNFFSNYEGINIWCSITEDVTEPCFRISLRSRNYKVSDVAKAFKGGGHDQAAGCQIDTLEELPKLIKALESVVIKGKK